ncbi:MAG: endonuclease/exonuclease/phosphatase family protein [Bacillota bacterium]|nr:endonuclease/exonuclease/phosphatase family protein [Bacillota bacterium]
MGTKSNSHLSFLTWNLYLGVDLTPLMTFRVSQMPKRVTRVFRQFLATNYPSRVKSIAREIALKKPDLIGLQEAVRWQLEIPNERTITYDFIYMLLEELNKYGLQYEIAVENHNVSAQLPDSLGNIVHLLDRDIILIQKHKGLRIINKSAGTFKTHLTVQVARQKLEILRGWTLTDLELDMKRFRIINTHLEEISSLQLEQANEIISGPSKTDLPVILLGDFNSSASGNDTPTYHFLMENGFQDVWKEVGEGPGFTYGQNPDLLNAKPNLNTRIDYILFKNGLKPVEAEIIGNKQSSRTPTGLWPSDHAGVYGKMILQ